MKIKESRLIQKLFFTLLISSSIQVYGLDIYVSKKGSDKNKGTKKKPLATLEKAKELAQAKAGKESVTIYVGDGIYYLANTLEFKAEDSGKEGKPVIYKAQNEGKAMISGGSVLDVSWKEYKNGIFQAKTPAGVKIDQLFVDGENQRMARYPNYDPEKTTEPYNGYAADAISKERAANWKNPKGAYLHAMHRSQWGGYHYLITGKDAEGEVTYEGGWQNNRKSGMHEKYRMVENVFEELDAQGEWYHDASTSTLYYYPPTSVNLKNATVEIIRLRHLIEFNGTESNPVKHIQFQGFVFKHAARTFMDTKEQLLRSDWAIYRGGAVMLTGTENISILDAEFDQVGGNAIFVNNYNRNTLVKGCHIHDAGASGVCFVGDPDAVKNPLFEYGQRNDLSKIDMTVGPKTNNYPSKGTVEDCLIHGIGRTERQPAGVLIEMAQYITIKDASIYDCARAGINIGDGAWGGHLIDRCDVFKTVQETHDHGSFNSWGRDRYWRHDHLTASQKAVDANPQLPFLDAMATTTIRNSRWRCDHGWDIDLDDGSSNYDIYNNVMLHGGLKLREGFRRRAWNNIIINNGLSSHVWFNNSKDKVYANIMGRCNGAYVLNDVSVAHCVDSNFYHNSDQQTLDKIKDKFQWDEHSLYGDPMFVDPEHGDYTVKEGSPAFKVGFKNFPMDQFGVKKPSLKAMAKTPIFPKYNLKGAKPQHGHKKSVTAASLKPTPFYWLGAKLKELEGQQFSAYGIAKSDGGLVVRELMGTSELAKAGVKQNDVILLVNGKKVLSQNVFGQILADTKDKALKLTVVRNQHNHVINITPSVYYDVAAAKDQNAFPFQSFSGKVKITTNVKTSNDPLADLTDGKLKDSYGAIFANNTANGMYKMDLGLAKKIKAVKSFTYSKGAERGKLNVTIYASNATSDPGWDVENKSKYTPIGTINTIEAKVDAYNQASIVSANHLGEYRWIVWKVKPLNASGENSSIQELSIDYAK